MECPFYGRAVVGVGFKIRPQQLLLQRHSEKRRSSEDRALMGSKTVAAETKNVMNASWTSLSRNVRSMKSRILSDRNIYKDTDDDATFSFEESVTVNASPSVLLQPESSSSLGIPTNEDISLESIDSSVVVNVGSNPSSPSVQVSQAKSVSMKDYLRPLPDSDLAMDNIPILVDVVKDKQRRTSFNALVGGGNCAPPPDPLPEAVEKNAALIKIGSQNVIDGSLSFDEICRLLREERRRCAFAKEVVSISFCTEEEYHRYMRAIIETSHYHGSFGASSRFPSTIESMTCQMKGCIRKEGSLFKLTSKSIWRVKHVQLFSSPAKFEYFYESDSIAQLAVEGLKRIVFVDEASSSHKPQHASHNQVYGQPLDLRDPKSGVKKVAYETALSILKRTNFKFHNDKHKTSVAKSLFQVWGSKRIIRLLARSEEDCDDWVANFTHVLRNRSKFVGFSRAERLNKNNSIGAGAAGFLSSISSLANFHRTSQRDDDDMEVLFKLDDYEVLEHLGDGSYGTVYKARHEDQPDKIVALKQFKKSKLNRVNKFAQGDGALDLVKQEIAIMKKMVHPNLVNLFFCKETIHDQDKDNIVDNNLYLVLEYCQGGVIMECKKEANISYPQKAAAVAKEGIYGSMQNLLDSSTNSVSSMVQNKFVFYPNILIQNHKGPKRGISSIDLETLRRIAGELVSGLAYMHKNGIVHRDLKPENILLSAEGTCKIADFGVSQICQTPLSQVDVHEPSQMGKRASTLYRRNTSAFMLEDTAGTPVFWAPETFEEDAYDAREVDVWALGVTMFCLAYGELPFPFDQANESLDDFELKITSQPPSFPDPNNMDPSLVEFINQLLIKKPKERVTAAKCVEGGFLKGLPVDNWEHIIVDEKDLTASIEPFEAKKTFRRSVQSVMTRLKDEKTLQKARSEFSPSNEYRGAEGSFATNFDASLSPRSNSTPQTLPSHSALPSPKGVVAAGAAPPVRWREKT